MRWNPMKRRRMRCRGGGDGGVKRGRKRRRKGMMKTRSGECVVADACDLSIRLPWGGGDRILAAVPPYWIVHCHHQTEIVYAH